MPDTQQEVLRSSDTRFINRTKWLVNQKSALDLRFATQSGDLVNWDTPEHDQYEVASAGMKPLEAADIPYTIAIGNHDTMATGVGGGARDARMTRIYQRDTRTFNSYFNASRYTKVGGAFESGKVDNIYSLYEAGGVKWMVLVLELWPRKAVVDWAKDAVAGHPDHNVIMVTHDYLDGAGGLGQSAGYGDTSPQYLWDNLISQYPNIKMTFSGHVGWATDRVYTGKNGNKIYSFLTTIHSTTTNPVRLLTVDTAGGDAQDLDLRPVHQRDVLRAHQDDHRSQPRQVSRSTAPNAGGARGLSRPRALRRSPAPEPRGQRHPVAAGTHSGRVLMSD